MLPQARRCPRLPQVRRLWGKPTRRPRLPQVRRLWGKPTRHPRLPQVRHLWGNQLAIHGSPKPAAVWGHRKSAARGQCKPAAVCDQSKSATRGQRKPAAVRGQHKPSAKASLPSVANARTPATASPPTDAHVPLGCWWHMRFMSWSPDLEPAPQQRHPVPASRKRYAVHVPPVLAIRQRPPVPASPEPLKCPSEPILPPRIFFFGGSRAPAEEPGTQPQRRTRYGRPNPHIHHDRPISLLRQPWPSELPAPPWVPEWVPAWRPPVQA